MNDSRRFNVRVLLAVVLVCLLPCCAASTMEFRRLGAVRVESDASNLQGNYSNTGNAMGPGREVSAASVVQLWSGIDKGQSHNLPDDVVMISATAPGRLEMTLIRKGKKVKSIPFDYRHHGNHVCLSKEVDVDFVEVGWAYDRKEHHLGVTSQGNLLEVRERAVSAMLGPFAWGTGATDKSEFPRIK